MKAIVVGVEKSKFAGNCPGSQLDAMHMVDVLGQYSSDVTLLLNESATISNFKSTFESSIGSDFTVLYYSGHGGSQRFSDTGQEETDGKDEFLCLHDGYFRDNDLWEIASKSTGKVFEIFDCCHSETMFRSTGIKMDNFMPRFMSMHYLEEGTEKLIYPKVPNVMVWSGCPDNTFSYGSASGGQFTNTLLKYFNANETYISLWNKIKNDGSLKRYEQVQKTIIGNFQENDPIFR